MDEGQEMFSDLHEMCLFSGLRWFRDGSVWTLEELCLFSDLILKRLRLRKDPRVMNVVNLYW